LLPIGALLSLQAQQRFNRATRTTEAAGFLTVLSNLVAMEFELENWLVLTANPTRLRRVVEQRIKGAERGFVFHVRPSELPNSRDQIFINRIGGATPRTHSADNCRAAGNDVATGKDCLARCALRRFARLNVATLIRVETRRRALDNGVCAGPVCDDRDGKRDREVGALDGHGAPASGSVGFSQFHAQAVGGAQPAIAV